MGILREFNMLSVLVRLLLALIFGGIVGLERGRQRRAAGMRTHILVCVGAALTALIGLYGKEILGFTASDPLRIAAQVISGMGFLGVGTILLKGRFQITGLTTAAGLWVAAAMGIAIGVGFYEGATVVFVVCMIAVTILNRVERGINDHHRAFGIYIEIREDVNIRKCILELEEKYSAHDIQVTVPRSGVTGNIGIEASIQSQGGTGLTLEETVEYFEGLDYVVYALESL